MPICLREYVSASVHDIFQQEDTTLSLLSKFLIRLISLCGLALLLLLPLSGYTASVAQASAAATGTVTTPLPNAHYQLVNAASNLCLDDYYYSTTPGQQMQQWNCKPNDTAQQWSLKSLGSGLYQIIVKASGFCLDDYNYSTTPGEKIQQWNCKPNDTAQEWSLKSLGNGLYQLVVQASGLCLDDYNYSTTPGQKMQQWTCTPNDTAQEWSFVASGPQLWAAPSGQGSTCSQTAPCSITTAQQQADALSPTTANDVTVNMQAGTYRLTQPLTFAAADSGANGYNIIYSGVGAQRPTISGSTAITGWTQTDATRNIWSATVPSTLATRQLYVNGVRAQVAQGPLPVTLTQTATGYTASAATLASWGNPADIEFVYTQGKGIGSWTEPRCRVASIAGTTITMSQPCWDNSTKRVKALGLGNNLSGSPTHIENAYELLTQPGQWYLNMSSHQLSYIPLPGQNMQTADVEAPTLQTLVQGNGTLDAPVHNLTFNNLQFAYATWLGPNSPDGFSEVQANYTLTGQHAAQTEGTCEYSTPQGSCPYGAWTQTPANVAFQAAQEVTFASDSFTHLGAAGLGLEYGSQNNLVYGSEFTDISGTGLQLGNVNDAHPSDVGADTREITSWNTIADNWFHNDAVEYHGGSGIFAGYTQHTLITHNQLNALPYDGIDFGWGGWHTNSASPTADTNINADNTISDNLIFDFKTVLADGGGIYTNGLQGDSFADGLFETGNVVYAQHNNNWALYNDQGSAYVTLNGNAEWDAPLGWGGCAPVGHILLENNYFADFVGTKYCSPNPIDVTQTNDTTISDNPTASALPASLLSAAGLEPAYQGLVTTTAPEVDLFSPNTGTASAPTSVLIDGSGFVANATQVAFVGGVAATQVTVLSPNFLVATAPTGAVLTAVSVTTPASPTFAPTAHYVFINQTTGLALDDGGAMSQSGADMFEYADQAATNTNQQFTIVAVGSGAYRITAVSDGLSLDDRGMTTASATMGQSSYTGSSNQQWRFYTTGNGSYEVLDSAGFALDGRGSTTNSTSVDHYSYNGSPNLQWRIIQVSP